MCVHISHKEDFTCPISSLPILLVSVNFCPTLIDYAVGGLGCIISINIGQNFTANKGYYIYYIIKNQIRLQRYTFIYIYTSYYNKNQSDCVFLSHISEYWGCWGLGVYIKRYCETTKHKFFNISFLTYRLMTQQSFHLMYQRISSVTTIDTLPFIIYNNNRGNPQTIKRNGAGAPLG